MYSVLRFGELSDADIESLGQQLERILPGVVDGPDIRCPDRVSISLADDDDWRLHLDSITTNVKLLDELIATMRGTDRTLELDFAIDPEDFERLLSEFVFDIQFLDMLVSRKIALTLSIYGGP